MNLAQYVYDVYTLQKSDPGYLSQFSGENPIKLSLRNSDFSLDLYQKDLDLFRTTLYQLTILAESMKFK